MHSLKSYFKSVKEVRTGLQATQTLRRALGNTFLAVLQSRTEEMREEELVIFFQVVSWF